MSADLEEALARRALRGADLYDAEAVVAPARTRVRRARTMRGLGVSAAATVVLGAAVAGIVALPSGSGQDLAPASPDAEPTSAVAIQDGALTAESLLAGASSRAFSDQDPGRQAAVLCSGLYGIPDGSTSLALCSPTWVAEEPLIGIVDAQWNVQVAEADEKALVQVDWTAVYSGDGSIVLGGAAMSAGLASDAGTIGPGAFVTGNMITATTLWPTETSRWVAVGGEPPAGTATLTDSDAAGILGGTATFEISRWHDGFTEDPLWGALTGDRPSELLTLTLQLPVAAQTDTPDWALYLEASTSLAIDPEADVALTADDLRAEADPRHREDYDRGAAQGALGCEIGADHNPRIVDPSPKQLVSAFALECDALWVSDDAPLVTLSEVQFDTYAPGSEVTVSWTAQNVSGRALTLDTAGMVVVETAWDAPPGTGDVIVRDALTTTTLWATDTTRHALLTNLTSVEVIQPWQLFAGSGAVQVPEGVALEDLQVTVLVRVAALDDAGEGELLLEAR